MCLSGNSLAIQRGQGIQWPRNILKLEAAFNERGGGRRPIIKAKRRQKSLTVPHSRGFDLISILLPNYFQCRWEINEDIVISILQYISSIYTYMDCFRITKKEMEYDGHPSHNWTTWILLMIWLSCPTPNSRCKKRPIMWRNIQHI